MLIMTPPVVPYRGTRGLDAFGGGGYGAPRSKACKDKSPTCPACKGTGRIHYSHKGLDFVSKPGDGCVFPFSGIITQYGWAYIINGPMRSIHIRGVDEYADFSVKILYVALLDTLKLGYRGEMKAPLGLAQNISEYHNAVGKMVNHVHYELRLKGELIDPTPYFNRN